MLGCLSPTVGKKNLSCHCFESVVSFKKYSNSHRSFFIRRAAFLEAGAAAFC